MNRSCETDRLNLIHQRFSSRLRELQEREITRKFKFIDNTCEILFIRPTTQLNEMCEQHPQLSVEQNVSTLEFFRLFVCRGIFNEKINALSKYHTDEISIQKSKHASHAAIFKSKRTCENVAAAKFISIRVKDY